MKHFETERLIIRTAEQADADALHALFCDADVVIFNCMPKTTIETVTELIAKDAYRYCIALKGDNALIGIMFVEHDDLRYKAGSRCISCQLMLAYRRKGYMKEALRAFINYLFDTEDIELISARAFEPNLASRALLKSLGFTHEGTLRHAVRSGEGIVYNDCLYSIKRDELATTV